MRIDLYDFYKSSGMFMGWALTRYMLSVATGTRVRARNGFPGKIR